MSKLQKLRALMRQRRLDYYFIPGRDAHQNEYVPKPWQRRAFISNFDGSNGDVLVGLDSAYLWTDGRYTLQARLQVSLDDFKIFEYQATGSGNIVEFLTSLGRKLHIGVDPQTITCLFADKVFTALGAQKSQLIFIEDNLVDAIWDDQPAFLNTPAQVYPLQYAGVAASDKISMLRKFMIAQNLNFVILNELNDIAWLFNLRGHDIEYTPLLLSYAIIGLELITLFVAPTSLTPEFVQYCATLQVLILPYEVFYSELKKLKRFNVGLHFKDANALMLASLRKSQVYNVSSPIALNKACKNAVELQGAVTAHIEDGLAICQFFCWLENHWQGLDEISLDAKFLEFRKRSPLFQELSFSTIVGYKDHGAIIHYSATPDNAYAIEDEGLLLIDSGGQYLGGTTDVTRTIHLGTPTAAERKCYTLVLKGHLALRHTAFAQGTRGEFLDVLARQFLWQHGLDYAHGTGHGVGSSLSVHEGPQYISRNTTTSALLPNMLTSNEPGFYLEGQFGIRIENVCYVKEVQNLSKNGKAFYRLEDLTLVPYCYKLIDVALLTSTEIDWINAYHQQIFDILAPRLDADTKAWLQEATRALNKISHLN